VGQLEAIVSIPLLLMAACGAFVLSGGAALADPWKDETGKDRWRPEYRRYYGQYEAHEFKEEYRVGGCKVERRWKAGEYKEEVKCR
jgi:hypothetical protein